MHPVENDMLKCMHKENSEAWYNNKSLSDQVRQKYNIASGTPLDVIISWLLKSKATLIIFNITNHEGQYIISYLYN